MKALLVVTLLCGALIVGFGSPVAREKPVLGHYYDSREPILPMNFAHADHVGENCIDCHHNYVDDTGGGPCMNCHMINDEVWPLLEQQYHDLCRGCHEDKAAARLAGGPPRACIACHMGDDLP